MTEEQIANDLILEMLAAGLRRHSTDIHLEPLRDEMAVKFRMENRLQEVGRHPAAVGRAARRALKRMFCGDPENEEVTQDGRILFEVEGRQVDVRVSSCPTVLGERLVMRIQDSQRSDHLIRHGLDSLDLDDAQSSELKGLFSQSYGLVLVSGLIGSGRTDTMYAALASLSRQTGGQSNLISLEAPVETFLPGVTQCRIPAKSGVAYSLRSALRQDPDAIFCSDIPDPESAREIVQAGLAGHLAVARVAGADAAGTLARFSELLQEPVQLHHLSMVLRGVCAQRMAWRLCPDCKQAHKLTPAQKKLALRYLEDVSDFYLSPGCEACSGSGLSGRTAIYQIVRADKELLQLLLTRPGLEELRQKVRPDLVECALRAAARGLVSLDEALRATA